MLTEGWDASTVTHILGVRAFGTQLLCEQVVGRGLRRSSYVPNDDGMFDPHYAEVFGVPFSFLPTAGIDRPVRPPVIPTRVHALPERAELEITFPRVVGYHYDFPTERLEARFSRDSMMSLSPMDLPTEVEARPAVGEYIWHDLNLMAERLQEVAFQLAKRVLDSHFVDADGVRKAWLFPQLVRISRRWMDECLQCKDDAFPQMLLVTELQQRAADHIHRAIVAARSGEQRLLPILDADQPSGTTIAVDFETVKPVYSTTKSQVSHVPGDSGWEHKLTQSLEDMPEVITYVKNQGLGLAIPYTSDGLSHAYWPDFVVRARDADGEVINLIIEVTGERRRAKSAKAETARDIWVPAVNAHGGFGRWMFLEIEDPYTAKSSIRAALQSGVTAAV
jgi:type III restriction enzyme